jgi:hypothetical protein
MWWAAAAATGWPTPWLYQIPTYAGDMLALLAQLKACNAGLGRHQHGRAHRHGGLRPAGLPLPVPVRRLVLNDVGPAIRWEAIERIKTYLGDTGRFESLEAAAAAMRAISATFGPHTDAQWLELSRPMVRPLEGAGGALTLHYDPAIAVPVRATTAEASAQGEAMLWQLYDNIQARTLLTAGCRIRHADPRDRCGHGAARTPGPLSSSSPAWAMRPRFVRR